LRSKKGCKEHHNAEMRRCIARSICKAGGPEGAGEQLRRGAALAACRPFAAETGKKASAAGALNVMKLGPMEGENSVINNKEVDKRARVLKFALYVNGTEKFKGITSLCSSNELS
jgi:hypothetical protein